MSANFDNELQELIQSISGLRTYTLIDVGVIAVTLYDTMICFADEYRLVWRGKWALGDYLYIWCRYLVPISLALGIPLRVMTDCSTSTIKPWFYTQMWLSAIAPYGPQMLFGLRTYVLYSGSRLAKWFILLIFLVEIVIVLTVSSIISKMVRLSEPPVSGLPCLFSVSGIPIPAVYVIYASGFALECTLWIMAQIKLFPLILSGQRNVSLILFRDGMLYFTAVTLITLVGIVLYAAIPDSPLSKIVEPLVYCMGSVLAARLILHLKAYASNDLEIDTHDMQISDWRVRSSSDV